MINKNMATTFDALLQAMTLTDMDVVNKNGNLMLEWQAETPLNEHEILSRSHQQVPITECPELAMFVSAWRQEKLIAGAQ